jgi:hypothetical protein
MDNKPHHYETFVLEGELANAPSLNPDACRKLAQTLDFDVENSPYDFSNSYIPKGCYAYRGAGSLSGFAFFSTGGTMAQMLNEEVLVQADGTPYGQTLGFGIITRLTTDSPAWIPEPLGCESGTEAIYALFSHVACMQLGMSSTKCTAEFQKQMAEAAMKYGKMDIQMWEGWVNNYVMSMMQGGQNMPPPGGGKPPMGRGRRLSDTDDFSLSALRSASASSALAREDGVLSRANFDARRLGGSGSGSGSGKSCSGPKGCVSNYIHYLGIYTKCIEQMKIKNSCSNVLAGLTSSDAQVTAFYSKTELVAAASCGKAVPVEPSECPVSFYDKEVYFMWGEGGFHATSERAKTSDVYVGKGLPAASRLDRLMNFFTEFFAAA